MAAQPGGVIREALDAALRDIPRPLLDDGPRGNLRRAAASLPPGFSAAYVELRPGTGGARTDLLACTTGKDSPSCMPSGDTAAVPRGWELAASVMTSWQDRDGELRALVPLVWLEFDDVAGDGRLPAPSVCVCVERRYRRYPSIGEPRPADWRRVIGRIVELPACPVLARECLPGIDHCLDHLPPEGRLIHFSLMSGRSPSVVKLYIGLPRDGLQRYLEDIGWPGDARQMQRHVHDIPPTEPLCWIDLTVDREGPQKRLGLAFPAPLRGPKFDARVFALAEELAGRRDRLEGLGRDLLEWTANSPKVTHGDSWPFVVHRWIDQKLVFHEEQDPSWKLYFGVRPLPALFGAAQARG